MKKTLIAIASLPLLMLAACSDDEPFEVQQQTIGQAISFRPSMASLSRATEVTNANLPSVSVTAILNNQNYFTDLLFAKDNTGFYNSAKSYYWPGDTTTIQFYAYYPAADVLGADVTIDSSTKEVANFEVVDSIKDQVDFITAYATGTRKANEAAGVPLQFKHRLSQIEVRAKSDNTTYSYEVAGVRLGRFQYLGTFNMADSAWTLDDWHDTKVWTSYCTPVKLTSDPVDIMGPSGNAMMLPQHLTPWDPKGDPDNVARESYISVLVRIISDTGVQVYPFPSEKTPTSNDRIAGYAWATIPLSGDWEQGKKYVYTLDFSDGAGNVDPDDPTPGEPVLGDPIKVVPTVTDWTDASSDIPMTPIK